MFELQAGELLDVRSCWEIIKHHCSLVLHTFFCLKIAMQKLFLCKSSTDYTVGYVKLVIHFWVALFLVSDLVIIICGEFTANSS